MGIFVKILIRAPLEELWRHTQDPALHEQWDLRFTRIRYLPRASEDEPQRFEYSTRIGFGVEICGEGESVGDRELPNGERASSLKFNSGHPLSLIKKGSGYWKYIPTAEGVWFITWYEYDTRFGIVGRLLDRAVFRPMMAWATAWSFDSLRMWLTRNQAPAVSRVLGLAHAISRGALAAIFAWHGLVPKLLARDADEIALLAAGGAPADNIPMALTALGIAELLFAAVLLLFRRKTWPAWITFALMLIVTAGISITAPRYVSAAFNPITLNFSVAAFALLDILTLRHTPSASHCEWSSARRS